VEATGELDLRVRVGVNTGEAVVASVLVGEATYRATRGVFDYRPLPPVRVKGKAGPLPVWVAASARSRLGVAVDQAPSTPFLGREAELGQLRRAYATARDERSVRLVTVGGEPGVGKSRLVREFRAFIDAQPELVAWRQGHCLPYGEGISFWALGEVLKAQAGILEFDDPAAVAAKLADAVAAAVEEPAERQWLETRLAPLLGLAGDAEARAATPEQEEAFSRRWRPGGRWSWSSRTCTGPTTPCWPSSATWARGPATFPCWWWPRPGPSCSTASRARRRPSRSRPCRTPTPPA